MLAVALVSGVSLHVDSQAISTLNNYLEDPNRTSDYFIETGRNMPNTTADFFMETRDNGSHPFIQNTTYGYNWFSVAFSDLETPEWLNESLAPNYSPPGDTYPILSVNDNFHEFYEKGIIMEEGTFDVGPGKAVITSTLFDTLKNSVNGFPSLEINSSFKIFDWLFSIIAATPFPNPILLTLKNYNFTSTLTLTGIMSDESPILRDFEEQGPNWITIPFTGLIFTSVDVVEVEMENVPLQNFFATFGGFQGFTYFQILMGQLSGTCLNILNCIVFTNFVSLQIDDTFIDRYNPDASLNELTLLRRDIFNFYSADPNFILINSDIENILTSYVSWIFFARATFSFLSFPIIFLGWYLLDFSMTHTYKSRFKELSGVKSRGMTDRQVLYMLIMELSIISIIGSVLGILLGFLVNSFIETSVGLLEFDLSLFNLNFNIISPFTFIFSIGFSFLLMFLSSYSSIRKILALPIDEMLREEEDSDSDYGKLISIKEFRTPLILIFISFIIIIGVVTLPQELTQEIFLIILGILGLVLLLLGSLGFMSRIAGMFPYLLNVKLNVGKKSTQFFIVSRDLVRKSKRVSATFIVLTLTIAFAIMSSISIETSVVYFDDSGKFEVGSDLRINIRPALVRVNPYENELFLSDKEFFPEIDQVSRIYIDRRAILLDEGIDISTYNLDSLRQDILYFREPSITAVFIDAESYQTTAFWRDDFFIGDVKGEEVFNTFRENPNSTVIIDERSAAERNIELGDSISFIAGRTKIYNGTKTVIGIAKYFSPSLDAHDERFVITSTQSISDEFSLVNSRPTTAYLMKVNTEDVDSRSVFLRMKRDRGGLDFTIDTINDAEEYFGEASDEGRQFDSLIKILRLNFYYASLIVLIGFFLVFELKVTDNARDISSLKALGLGRFSVINLILLEGLITVLVAGITGTAIGFIGGVVLNGLLPSFTIQKINLFPIDLIILQLIFAIVSAIIGSLLAGSRTFRFKITELIRHT
jgi:ABC-type lipoprotein release transport system permease subunit